MPLPPDIQQRIAKAKDNGFTDEQIQADIQRKYGETPVAAPKSGAEKVGDFLGISNFGKGLGSALAAGSRDVKNARGSADQARKANEKLIQRAMSKPEGPEREALLKVARDNGAQLSADSGAASGVADAPTNKQFISGALNTLLNIGGAGTVGGKAATGKLATKVAAQPLKRAVVQAAVQSGGLGASNAYGADKSAGQIAAAGAGGAAVGAATTGIIGGLAKLFNKATTTAPAAVYKTSTRVPNKTNTELLLKEGVVGGRDALRKKAEALVAEAGANIASDPAAKGATVTGEQIWNYGPLQELRQQAQRLGQGEVVDRAIIKVMPKPTGVVAETIPKSLQALQDKLDDLAAKGAKPEEIARVAEEYTTRANSVPLLEALKQKIAIDRATPPSVFTDRATAMTTNAEGEVANAIRSAIAGEAPTVTGELGRQAPALALLKELTAFDNAKASPIPYGVGNLLQRTLLTPAVGTRIARAGYLAGAPARAASTSVASPQVRQLLRALLLAGANSSTN